MRLPLLLLLAACGGPSKPAEEPTVDSGVVDPGPPPAASPAPPVVRRLTQHQYRSAIRDLFGPEVFVPARLEPDEEVGGLFAVGSATTTISPLGVELYEQAALAIAGQVMDDAALRARVVPCAPDATVDEACAAAALAALGRRAWRRPLAAEELDALVGLAGEAATVEGDFYAGLAYPLAAMLQAPSFLFRFELGESDGAGGRVYTDWEMASRLSFFFWDSIPDEALLDAAAAGLLHDDDALAAEVDRLLADPRARDGVRNLASELFNLHELDLIVFDPWLFPHYDETVAASAREETLLNVEEVVFEEDAPWDTLFTRRRTFVDRKLASIYGVAAPTRDGFGPIELPEGGGRVGYFGQVSFLGLNAHSTLSSPTLRGLFVRHEILCQGIPAPPANVNTSIPEPSADAPTMRERIAVHLEDPSCAGCHRIMDPVGLGFENFDAIGGWRLSENGATIDPSGELDGVAFGGPEGLAAAVAAHRQLSPCLAETVFAYANGHRPGDGEAAWVEWLAARFDADDRSLRSLLRHIALSPSFRRAAEVE